MIERIASVRHKDGSITIKPFFGEDLDTAEQMAREWIATIVSNAEQIQIEYKEFFLLSIKHFIRSTTEVVWHSRELSDADREFLAGCLISFEDLRIPCCGQGHHPNVMPVDEAIKKLEDLRDKDKS